LFDASLKPSSRRVAGGEDGVAEAARSTELQLHISLSDAVAFTSGASCAITGMYDPGPAPQALEGVTRIYPFPELAVTVIVFELPPPVCIHPDGNSHIYEVPLVRTTE